MSDVVLRVPPASTAERRAAQPLRRVLGRGGALIALSALAASTLYPLVFIVTTSLRTDADYRRTAIGLPREFTLSNLRDAWDRANLGTYAVNSVIVVSSAVVMLTVIAALAGFAFAQLRVPLGRAVLAVIVALMIVPPAVLMIPIFKLVSDLGMVNKFTGVILVYASLNLPFSVYLITTYMRGIPHQIIEAARIDGASALRTFWTIAVPLSRPGLATLATLNFLVLWNELMFSLILLQQDSKRTVMVGISVLKGQYLTSVPIIAAGLLFSIVPPLIIFSLFQRDLVRGLTSGALK